MTDLSMKQQESKAYFSFLIIFFVFASLFPTIRILTIGGNTSTSIAQYIFSLLPEIAAIAVLVLSFVQIKKRKEIIKINMLDWFVFVFAISNVVVGTIIANDLVLSAYGIRMTYFPISFYFIFRFLNIKELLQSVHLIFLWIFALVIAGIVLYFCFYDTMIAVMRSITTEVAEYFVVRMTSVFWTPVVFSTFAMVAFFYFVHLFLSSGKWGWLAIVAVINFALIMSMSRGAMVAAIVGFIVLAALHPNIKLVVYTLISIIAVFLISTTIVASPEEISSWLYKSTSSTLGLKKGVTRVDLWINTFNSFKTHPFGMGIGKAGHVAARFLNENTSNASVYSTDGWFLKTLIETGIWGLLSYLIFACTFFILLIKNIVRDRKNRILVFLLTVFIAINLQNMVSNVLDFYLFSYLYWGLIGLTANIIYNKPRTNI